MDDRRSSQYAGIELRTQGSANPYQRNHSRCILIDCMEHLPVARTFSNGTYNLTARKALLSFLSLLQRPNAQPWLFLVADTAPSLAPSLLAHAIVRIGFSETQHNPKTAPRSRVVILTTAALASIISGAFISVAAMTNFPQAIFFGCLLFLTLEVGTWWTLHCATSQTQGTTLWGPFVLSSSTIALAAYYFPMSLTWALGSLLTSLVLASSISKSPRIFQSTTLPILASMIFLEITTRHGLEVFLKLIAISLGQAESEPDVVRLLFQESVMFGNRFVAQWQGIVTALQLVARVILHLHIQDTL